MAYLEEFVAALSAPIFAIWSSLQVNFVGIVTFSFIVIVGYLIGAALGFLLSKALEHSKIDQSIERVHIHDALGFIKLHVLLGLLLKWFVVSLFIQAAASRIPSERLADLVATFAAWMPGFLAAILLFSVGLIFSEFVYRHFMLARTRGLRTLGAALKVALIIIAALMALEQMNLQVSLASNIALVIVAAAAFGIALAFGIGVGLAAKDEAKVWLKDLRKKSGKDE